jgi:hypothetical protein
MGLLAKLVVACCGVLAVWLAAPSIASAHAGHAHVQRVAHRPAVHSSLPQLSVPKAQKHNHKAVFEAAGDASSELVEARSRGPAGQPLHAENCCCGSIACHAGVAATVSNISDPYRFGERLATPPVLALAKSDQGGIERPPRMAATH